jgi:hypothetical protein
MVNGPAGLDIFKEYFKDFSNCYILIGGTAASIAMDELAGDFRATKDLDIVLTVEALNQEFARKFWQFIKDGNYQIWQRADRVPQFYRFLKPQNPLFPAMLELFSRIPDTIKYDGEGTITPIPLGEEVSSLSAILLNDDYYYFINQYKHLSDGLAYIGPECLIPLKAKAYTDLSERKKNGEAVDSSDIKKHKNDIFRIYTIINPQLRISLPSGIKSDLMKALDLLLDDQGIDLKNLGIKTIKKEKIIANLKKIYGLAD